MSLRESLANLVKKPAVHSIYHKIPPDKLRNVNVDATEVIPEKAYLRLKLVQMFLGIERFWTQTRAPVVHAYPKFLHQTGYLEMPVIIGPGKVKAIAGDQPYQRMVTMNQTIVGPVPYLGGDFEVIMALFASETKNYADDFLDLLGSLSSVVPITGLSTAVAIMRPMEQGIEKMIDVKDLVFQIGVQDTFANPVDSGVHNPLRSQYSCVVAMEEKKLDPDCLWLTDTGLRLDDGGKPGPLLEKCDYFVFKTEIVSKRAWAEIVSLSQLWSKVEEVIKTGNRDRVKDAFDQFKWAVNACGDLLASDRKATVADKKAFIESLFEEQEREKTHVSGPSLGGPTDRPRRFPHVDVKNLPPQVSELFRQDLIDASKLELEI